MVLRLAILRTEQCIHRRRSDLFLGWLCVRGFADRVRCDWVWAAPIPAAESDRRLAELHRFNGERDARLGYH